MLKPEAFSRCADHVFTSVCLQDSVLAFWRHGMQGRGLKSNEVIITQSESRNLPTALLSHNLILSLQVTQEIVDSSRIFRLLSSDRSEPSYCSPVCSPVSHLTCLNTWLFTCLSAGWWFWRAEQQIIQPNTVTCTSSLDTKTATETLKALGTNLGPHQS